MNFKFIALKLGDGLKYDTTVNEINRVASAIFDFPVIEHPHDSITSVRSKLTYNWVMTLADTSISYERKIQLLTDFIIALTPEGSPLRNLINSDNSTNLIDFWTLIHDDIRRVSRKRFIDEHY